MKETLVLKFDLPLIEKHLYIVNHIVSLGYRKTGNKFTVSFNGSRGYLDNIEISCEGYQKEENRLDMWKLRNKNGSYKKKMVNIFHSNENGVRLSIGKDQPRIIKTEIKEGNTIHILRSKLKNAFLKWDVETIEMSAENILQYFGIKAEVNYLRQVIIKDLGVHRKMNEKGYIISTTYSFITDDPCGNPVTVKCKGRPFVFHRADFVPNDNDLPF